MINNSIEKNENAKRTTFIYKFVDKQHLGVKMYEDDSIGTIPYSFYGGRKLYHVNNQMMDADEKLIEMIVTNWGVQPFFQPLVLKTIYCFVGKSFTMYTLEIGSEVPVKKRTCEHLKQWLEELEIKKSSNVATSYGNSKELSQRIQDTSNEIFHLTKLIEKKLTMVANLSPSNVPTTEDQVKNPQVASFPSPRKKILGREQINKHLVAEMKEESNRFSGPPNGKHRQLVFRKNLSNEVLQPKTWLSLTKFVYSTKRIVSYHRKITVSARELKKLEIRIERCFSNNQIEGGRKKKRIKKIIPREELIEQINKVRYVSYLWSQIYMERKKDLLIRNRLSCIGLISSLDALIRDLKDTAYHRSILGKYGRCSTEQLARLEGYILLEQFLQKLVLFQRQEQVKRKTKR